jgi:hypothetical protein
MTNNDLAPQWRGYALQWESEARETDDLLHARDCRVRAETLRGCARTIELMGSRLNETHADETRLEVRKTGGV